MDLTQKEKRIVIYALRFYRDETTQPKGKNDVQIGLSLRSNDYKAITKTILQLEKSYDMVEQFKGELSKSTNKD